MEISAKEELGQFHGRLVGFVLESILLISMDIGWTDEVTSSKRGDSSQYPSLNPTKRNFGSCEPWYQGFNKSKRLPHENDLVSATPFPSFFLFLRR